MKWIVRLIVLVIVLAIAAAAYLYFSGRLLLVLLSLTSPPLPFSAQDQPPAPDYALEENWAALPSREDLADFVPAGLAPRTGEAPVAVFYIHPTGYINPTTWTSPMDPGSITEDNTRWMMANQASAYNGCCDVYAPRYREAALHAFFADVKTRDEVLAFAYGDVERAFDYFLANFAAGRPFIIASHSQGSYHAMTLIERRIDGTDLRERMVAAYAIGVPAGTITTQRVAALKTVKACDSAQDIHCLIHFATYGEGTKVETAEAGTVLCTNPLSWRNDGARAQAELHRGAVVPSGQFTIKPFAKDVSENFTFSPLGAPMPALTYAECRDGALFVKDLAGGPFESGLLMNGNYHGLDYPLFYIDIRENAVARAEAFLAAASATSPPAVTPPAP